MPLEYLVGEKSIDRTSAELSGFLQPLARLKQALAKDEFSLYCQPIRSLRDGRYAMGEVLVRMREEEAALLPPGDFFPVFEHYRMMPQLDRWVLRHTIKRLQAGSRVPQFTVNLAGQTIEDLGVSRIGHACSAVRDPVLMRRFPCTVWRHDAVSNRWAQRGGTRGAPPCRSVSPAAWPV